MEREIVVGGKTYRMRASALIPRIYRAKFGRDLIVDMQTLSKKLTQKQKLTENASEEDKEIAQMSAIDLTIFENVAWVMLKTAGEDVGNSPDEWLDTLDGFFDIYTVLPEILSLWAESQKQTSVPKNPEGRR